MNTILDISNIYFPDLLANFGETLSTWLTYDPTRPLLFNSPLFLGLFIVFYIIYVWARSPKRGLEKHLQLVFIALLSTVSLCVLYNLTIGLHAHSSLEWMKDIFIFVVIGAVFVAYVGYLLYKKVYTITELFRYIYVIVFFHVLLL